MHYFVTCLLSRIATLLYIVSMTEYTNHRTWDTETPSQKISQDEYYEKRGTTDKTKHKANMPHTRIRHTRITTHFKFCLDYGKFSIAAAAVSNEMPVDNLTITKNYFKVNFDGEKWVARWNWIKEPVLRNCIDFYKMDEAAYPRFKSEVNRWIDNVG